MHVRAGCKEATLYKGAPPYLWSKSHAYFQHFTEAAQNYLVSRGLSSYFHDYGAV